MATYRVHDHDRGRAPGQRPILVKSVDYDGGSARLHAREPLLHLLQLF